MPLCHHFPSLYIKFSTDFSFICPVATLAETDTALVSRISVQRPSRGGVEYKSKALACGARGSKFDSCQAHQRVLGLVIGGGMPTHQLQVAEIITIDHGGRVKV